MEELVKIKCRQGQRKKDKKRRAAEARIQRHVETVENLVKKQEAKQKLGNPMGQNRLEAQWSHGEQENENDLNLIVTVEPEGVNSVDTHGEWEVIDMAVDSGASETVVNEDMLPSTKVEESEHSRRGVQYEVANGVRIPNLGEKAFKGETEEGLARAVRAQVCDVNKALLSVRKVVMAGNRVVFDQDGSFIEDKVTGEKIWLKDDGHMYMLRMWVKKQGF